MKQLQETKINAFGLKQSKETWILLQRLMLQNPIK
jgi:hypothetical protein